MPLRCLLFSSHEEIVQPIWQVLADLGAEGEYSRSAPDAVEKVTTQPFQIVIVDWEDQPEATYLLKKARDLKAAQRPLTLAIVNDDARLPEALQAGANSVLKKPIRPEQARDKLSTACELLRSKMQTAAPAIPRGSPQASTMAAAAGATVAAPAPPFVAKAPPRSFRAGEFLQAQSSAPGGQFDTESEVQESPEQCPPAEIALTELEPMAAAVEDAPAEVAEKKRTLTGWASLQTRLTKSPPAATGSESGTEAVLPAYSSGESDEASGSARTNRPHRGGAFLIGTLALVGVALAAVPQTRQRFMTLYRDAVQAGGSWLNPQPVPVEQEAPQHDSFGQAGDEYKMPVAGNIPDATTDPSQIRVLPVVDPTAKPAKDAEANAGQMPTASGDKVSGDASQTGENQRVQEQATGEVGGPAGASSTAQSSSNAPVNKAATPPRMAAPSVPGPAPTRTVSAGASAAIPSSLQSQTAATTPEASGAMPPEAAMSSIEPVKLPEYAARGLLVQPVDAIYPDAARASGQRGSVVLEVLIGRDGAVQDAKFLQGSFVFARSAIDAVRQWRFKPYLLNGRAVSVQSTITLNFKPPA